MYGMLPESKPSGRWLNPIDDNLVAYPHNSKPLGRRRKKKPPDQPPLEEPQDEAEVGVSRTSFLDPIGTGEDSPYDSKLPKQVLFYRNGDKFYKGKRIRITPQKYFSLDGLLSDLTKSVSLPYGVRKLYTPTGGTQIKHMEEIRDGESYVCASFEKFKKLKYGAVKDQSEWKTSRKADANSDLLYGQSLANSYPAGGKYATAYGKSKGRTEPIPFTSGSQAENIPADSRSLPPKYLSSLNNRPKLVKIVKAGKKPYQSVSLLLNRKSILSFEQLMQDISEAFRLPNHRSYKISRLYNAKGDEIKGVADFFRDQDSVVVGATLKNPLTGELLVEILEEVLPDSSLSRRLKIKQMKENVLKADSGIENDDDVSSQELPSIAPPRARKSNKQREDKGPQVKGTNLSGGDQKGRDIKLDNTETRQTDIFSTGEEHIDVANNSSGGKVGDNRVIGKNAKRRKAVEDKSPVDEKVTLTPRGPEEEKDQALSVSIKKNPVVQDDKEKIENKKNRSPRKPVHIKGKRHEKQFTVSKALDEERESPEGKENKKTEKPKKRKDIKEVDRKQKKTENQKTKATAKDSKVVGTDASQRAIGVDEKLETNKRIEVKDQDEDEAPEDLLAKLLSTTAQEEAERELKEGLQPPDKVRESKTQESSIPEELDFIDHESTVDISSDSKVDLSSDFQVDLPSELQLDLALGSEMGHDKGLLSDADFTGQDKSTDETGKDVGGRFYDIAKSETNTFDRLGIAEDDNNTDDKNFDYLDDRKEASSSPNKDFEFSGKSGRFVIIPRKICSEKDVLEKYQLGEKVGDGNFADVHVGKLRTTGEDYAIKKVDKSKLKGKESMIENEIAILKEIDHPNIVKLYEEFETDHYIYLIMDFVRGGDLFDAIIDSVKFTEADASVMVRDLARALDYLHRMNVVHRDMKPENLLVNLTDDSKMQLKLADFGLAMEVVKPVYTVCGTPTYVAPEILAETGYGLPVDMWALGVITYILLCGFPPFRSPDRNQDELFDLIQSGKYEYISPYWNSISKTAKDLIDHLLVVDQKQRFTAVQVLEHPWVRGGERNNSATNLQREVSINLEKNFSRPSSSKR